MRKFLENDMTKIELQIHDDVIRTINKIKSINDSGVELSVPEGSVLFDNILNLKLIDQQAESMGKSIQFSTDDEAGNTLISMLEKGSETTFRSETPDEGVPGTLPKEKKKIRIPFPKISFRLPKINLSGKPALLYLLIPSIIVIIAYVMVGSKTPKATAKIVLTSDPFTRSVTVKVKLNSQTDQENSLLKGTRVESTMQSNGEAETTGEKLLGEKAKGTVTIYNKSTDEITLKKGTGLVYEKDDKEYEFSLDSEVSIPSSHQQSSDPGSPIIPGEKETDVTAEDIGSGYNIDKDKSLQISKYKKSVLEAKSKEDFEGGKADRVKIVSESDRVNLSTKLLEQSTASAEIALKSKMVSPNKLIPGAIQISITKESFSHKVGDETEKITLEQTVTITGLSYSETELSALLNKLIDKMTPQGYSLSKKDWSVKVEPLGNSSSSVLSANEADLQVTLKTSVIPIINKEEIKKSMAGKSSREAEKILGSVKNVKNYELNVTPVIPFFKKVPKDTSRIELVVENE
jgi:hypothetical protein